METLLNPEVWLGLESLWVWRLCHYGFSCTRIIEIIEIYVIDIIIDIHVVYLLVLLFPLL